MDEEKCCQQNEALKFAGQQLQNLEKVQPCPLVRNEATALKSKVNPIRSPFRSPIRSPQYGILTTQNTNLILLDNQNTTPNKQIVEQENNIESPTEDTRSDIEKDEFFIGTQYIYPFGEYFVESDYLR